MADNCMKVKRFNLPIKPIDYFVDAASMRYANKENFSTSLVQK